MSNPQLTAAPITPEKIAALRDALAKATPGEWVSAWDTDKKPQPIEPESSLGESWVIRSTSTDLTADKDGLVVSTMYYDGLWAACTAEDARAIVAAYNLAPKLLAALDAAEAEIEKLNRSIAITSNREDNAVRKWLGEQFTFTFAKRRNLSSDGQYHETPEQYVLVEADTAMAALRNALGLTRVAEANAKEAEAKAVEFAWDALAFAGACVNSESGIYNDCANSSAESAAEYLAARGLLRKTGERIWQRVEGK